MIVGVDYDTFKATLVALPFAGDTPAPVVAEARWRTASQGGDALDYLFRIHASLEVAKAEIAKRAPSFRDEPSVYFIERGFGMSRRSDFLLGAFLGAIYADLYRTTRDAVNLMDLREWKAVVTFAAGIGLTANGRGNGNAKKVVANEACRALLARIGVDASSWSPDQLDAYGVALTGRDLNARAAA